MTPDPVNRRLGVLISGRGSNLQALNDAIVEGRLDARIAVVISNREDAGGLDRARAAGIEAICISHRGWPSRDDYDAALAAALHERQVGLVCLAGFMRRVGRRLIDAFPGAILNIHPSLLPSFPGTNAQRQAIEHGVRVSGVTVHLVNEQLDAGPIVVQQAVPVLGDDTAETLAARIVAAEHESYPRAVQILLDGGWQVIGRRFVRSPIAGPASAAPPPAGS